LLIETLEAEGPKAYKLNIRGQKKIHVKADDIPG
jgi:hypothetical protein